MKTQSNLIQIVTANDFECGSVRAEPKAKGKECSSCRNGEIYGVPADYQIAGVLDGDRPVPFRANVCAKHAEILQSENSRLKIKKRFNNS